MNNLCVTWSRFSLNTKRLWFCGTGILGALSHTPMGLFFLMPISLALLFMGLHCEKNKNSDKLLSDIQGHIIKRLCKRLPFMFKAVLLFATFYFAFSLWWISEALMVEQEFMVLIPFALTLIPVGLGLFWAICFGVLGRFWSNSLWKNISLFTVSLVLAEWLRSWLFTGFPWNMPVHALGGSDILLQNVSLWGTQGLNALLTLFSAMLGGFLLASGLRQKAMYGVIIMGMSAQAVGYGVETLHQPLLSEQSKGGQPVNVRLVQPNIQDFTNWSPENRDFILSKTMGLSDTKTPTDGGFTVIDAPLVIVWPESGLPYDIGRDAPLQKALTQWLGNRYLITGFTRQQNQGFIKTGEVKNRQWYNSLGLIEGNDKGLTAVYDKKHLVPFGEYVPFASVLGQLGVKEIVNFHGGYSAGQSPSVLHDLDKKIPPFLALICYESIFGGEITSEDAKKAKWVTVITNDGWFGESWGPYQHLMHSRFRAVELGLPVVRVANTGFSAFINERGQIKHNFALAKEMVIDYTFFVH